MKTYTIKRPFQVDAVVIVLDWDEYGALPETPMLAQLNTLSRCESADVFIHVARVTPRLDEVMATKDMEKILTYLYEIREEVDSRPDRIRRVDYERDAVVPTNPIETFVDAAEANIWHVARVAEEGAEGAVGIIIGVDGKQHVATLGKDATDEVIAALIHQRNCLWPTP